jgi:hypothetical protein
MSHADLYEMYPEFVASNCADCGKPLRESDKGFFGNGKPVHFECLTSALGRVWDMSHMIVKPKLDETS